jgi:hypothetical protein
MPSTRRVATLVALAVTTSGCKSCKDDHPYVPYSIDEGGVPSNAAPIDAAVADEDAGAFHAREAIAAPKGATRWPLDGFDLAAPADRVFTLGLTGDFDGDGVIDAAALVSPTSADPDAGPRAAELVLYRGVKGGLVAAGQTIASPPPLAFPATCTAKNRLAQTGKHTLLFETGASCPNDTQLTASRYVAAVVVGADAKTHFRATLLDPPNAPLLSLDVDGADRDGDGLDDVTLRVTIEGGSPPFEPGPRVSATVRWFDRSAGMSRDPGEPEASLRALASIAAVRAPKAKDAPSVPRFVEQVRALHRALCVEGGSPRVVDLLNAPALQCGGASKGLEEAGLAEVRAYAVSGDAQRAIAALDRAQLAPATHTASRTTDAQAWIAQLAPIVPTPSVLRATGAVPQIERGRGPSWGALAFEASGKLLVRTAAGVVRMDPAQGDEAAAEDVTTWRAGVVSPDGAYRWIEAYDACDGVALHATFAPTANGDARDVALPIAPPLGAHCTQAHDGSDHAARGDPAPTLAVAWGTRGLEAVVAGEPILVSPDLVRATPSQSSLDQPTTLGSPRSPNGRVLVTSTTMGLLVRGAHSRLFRARELEGGYLDVRDCTVSDDASRVACVRGGRAFVGIWAPE